MVRHWIVTFLLFIFVATLSGCTNVLNSFIERPKDPPKLYLYNGLNVDRKTVSEYQEILLNYIRYLERYYLTIGVYYGGKTELPNSKSKYDDTCYIVSSIFNDVPLPPPPRVGNRDAEHVLNLLIDHITVLRKTIRENNVYMETLRQRYKSCK